MSIQLHLSNTSLAETGIQRKAVPFLTGISAIGILILMSDVHAAIDNRDTIERAFGQESMFDLPQEDHLDLLVGDQFAYDDNLFRLPDAVNAASVVGPNASRQDHINTQSLQLDGRQTYGRQVVTVDLRAANNRFDRNDDLNNISSRDRVDWAWALGDQLSGQVGAEFDRSLAGFVNTNVYSRNIVTSTHYFAAGRYQIGPHWAIFGALLDADTSLGAAASKNNNNKQKSGDFGTEYALSATDSIGLEYRYTDVSFPRSPVPENAKYREETERILFRYAITERTLIDASYGYLKRTYGTSLVRDFSGNVWRATIEWQGSVKTQILLDVWRKLQAYETAQTDYFATTGGRVSPVWKPTDKISLSVDVTYNNERYIGTNAIAVGARHDTVRSENVVVTYTPLAFLIFSASAGFDARRSNDARFAYSDRLIGLGATFKF